MTTTFETLTDCKSLQQECESLLAQIKFHQCQIKELPRQVILEMIDTLFYPEGEALVHSITVEEIEHYLEQKYGK